GSKYLAGLLDEDTIASLRGADGRTAEETLRAAGMNPGRMKADRLAPGCGRIFLECHIEQNAVLEREGLSIGIVTAITGMRLHRVTLHGVSDHAASPMEGRRDPAAGFAECAYAMERMWTDGILPRGFSCTVGHAEFTPGVGIVIPGAVEFTVDLRHVDTAELEKGWAAILETFGRIADRRGLTLETERLSASGGALMSQEAQDTLAAIAAAEGAAFRRMVSGPAHDAAAMASVMPAGMVFVPSCGGLSHCPAERTEPADLALGARIFESAVRHFAEGRPAMEEAQPPR
ncbi:MAG: M20/M25/M40 family metallo-hydrolase, partial [Mailhella sp.]|nr:M20/M25/M40 family metallo-hydrolase [Mailhella sp.]